MEPEVHGLVALMEIQASRAAARVGPKGEPILLLDQDRRRWNRLLIQRGLAALDRAERLRRERGPYTLQAAIAACHARAAGGVAHRLARASRRSTTSWRGILPSPVVELNRAVAHGMAFGPRRGPGDRRSRAARAVLQRLSLPARRARRSAVQVEAVRRGAEPNSNARRR